MNLMRPFFLLILFLSAALPAAGAESKFAIAPVGGKVTASWKGMADTSGIDLAPADHEIAALAELDQVTRLNLDHVMLPVEGAASTRVFTRSH